MTKIPACLSVAVNKIEIKKDSGPIIFLGGMNAMPMMYALELHKNGYDILYFVDRPKDDYLSRPESHFKEISYPYPDWIIEYPILTQMALPFFKKIFAKKIEYIISKKRKQVPQAFILNGFFISLAGSFSSNSAQIALSHGSDIDSWADVNGLEVLQKSFSNRSFFKFLPKWLSIKLIKKAVISQFDGLRACKKVIYFPKGFCVTGDRVINRLEADGVDILSRFDVSFDPLIGANRDFNENSEKLVIFSGVRFNFETFTEGNDQYNKGNDIIIRGLAKFYLEYKNIEVHFVEKGPDVLAAKKMCTDFGLSDVVIWHKEMKFTELISLYEKSDVCFDQVGDHWIGAIGAYALWLGKPLIANDDLPVRCGLWPENNPICSAKDDISVYLQLKKLNNIKYRKILSEESKIFCERYFAKDFLLNNLFIMK